MAIHNRLLEENLGKGLKKVENHCSNICLPYKNIRSTVLILCVLLKNWSKITYY